MVPLLSIIISFAEVTFISKSGDSFFRVPKKESPLVAINITSAEHTIIDKSGTPFLRVMKKEYHSLL